MHELEDINVIVERNDDESVVDCKFGQHLPADSFNLNDSIAIFSG